MNKVKSRWPFGTCPSDRSRSNAYLSTYPFCTNKHFCDGNRDYMLQPFVLWSSGKSQDVCSQLCFNVRGSNGAISLKWLVYPNTWTVPAPSYRLKGWDAIPRRLHAGNLCTENFSHFIQSSNLVSVRKSRHIRASTLACHHEKRELATNRRDLSTPLDLRSWPTD